MKPILLLSMSCISTLMAVPVAYNNNAWYSGLDPYLVGRRENFLIQGVTVDAVRDANGFTGAFQAVLKFNYGGPSPAIGNLSTISPYEINVGGVVSALYASDLFFKQSGVIRYGVPLVDHGGGSVNGHALGDGVFDDGDLYHISNGIQTISSNQFLSNGTDETLFGSGRTVWMTSAVANPQALASGSTQIYFNGECSATVCNQPEYTVTLNISAAPVQGSSWYQFLLGVADGSITPYYTGTSCGNDLVDGAVPEPSSLALVGIALTVAVLRAKRRN